MSIANLQETLLAYTLRKNQLELEIMENQARKTLAVAQTADTNSLLAANKAEIRTKWRTLFEENPDKYAQYDDYTEIPDFDEEMDRMTAYLTEQLDELAAWETEIDNELKRQDVEMIEIDTYIESIQQMLQQNIQDDFDFGGGG